MPAPVIDQLLAVQNEDQRLRELEDQLAEIPREREAIEERRSRARERLAEAEGRLQSLEKRRREIEGTIAEAEEKVRKYRTQQMEVKKNEEYQAFEQEIAALQSNIGDWETEDVELLLEIDEASARVEEERAAQKERLGELGRQEDFLTAREKELQAEVEGVRQAFERVFGALDTRTSRLYEQVRRSRPKPPYLVPLSEGKCSGCHLRVSNEVAKAARHEDEPQRCDNCARIVYYA